MWRVTVCTCQIKQVETVRLRSTHEEAKKNIQDFGREEWRKWDNFGEPGVGGNIILKRTLNR
jgi:hypothetical protein